MTDESWMWTTLNVAMKDYWRAERMQSSFAPGLADVCFTMFPCREHECSWMELKVVYGKGTDEPLKIPHYNAAQKDWLQQRRTMQQPVYIMLYTVATAEWILLDGSWRNGRGGRDSSADLPGELFQWLGTSLTMQEIRENAIWVSDSLKKFALSVLVDTLSDYSKVVRVNQPRRGD